ncbi:hypothetical protein V491_07399 [Pseudogymnoascus sp. VKM F-3775]|nr:hypothetical protein V491_07399 [Pseudogymnoascus sp. VKM F-3775]
MVDDSFPLDMTTKNEHLTDPLRVVIVGASVGAGHNYAARELQKRLRDKGVEAHYHDFLDSTPWLIHVLLRDGYGPCVNHFPWLFTIVMSASETNFIFHLVVMFCCWLSTWEILVWTREADIVVTTYGLASQSLGWLRLAGYLEAPVISYLCDAGAHGLLFHKGVDLNIAPFSGTVSDCKRYGFEAIEANPLVREVFALPVASGKRDSMRRQLEIPAMDKIALVCAGSLGLGRVSEMVKDLLKAKQDMKIIVLCGRNHTLQSSFRGESRVVAMGWRDDLPDLLVTADVVVHNAGGMVVWESAIAKIPLITYLALPGQGQRNAGVLAESSVSPWPRNIKELAKELEAAFKQTRLPPSLANRFADKDVTDIILNWTKLADAKMQRQIPILAGA